MVWFSGLKGDFCQASPLVREGKGLFSVYAHVCHWMDPGLDGDFYYIGILAPEQYIILYLQRYPIVPGGMLLLLVCPLSSKPSITSDPVPDHIAKSSRHSTGPGWNFSCREFIKDGPWNHGPIFRVFHSLSSRSLFSLELRRPSLQHPVSQGGRPRSRTSYTMSPVSPEEDFGCYHRRGLKDM